jgi:transposase
MKWVLAMNGAPALPREVQRRFWRLIKLGLQTDAAAAAAGVSPVTARRWFNKAGGMSPVDLAEPSGRSLSYVDRLHIEVGLAAGLSNVQIAGQLGRHPSTIGQEISRNSPKNWPKRYRARFAQAASDARCRRPKVSKLAACKRLCDLVQEKLSGIERLSPEQISG